MYKFALSGSPNVGKTSIFNRITHSLAHTGNWHGVTVEKREKVILYDHKQISVTDLPGLYSLTAYSAEETVSRDEILSGQYNLIVNVCEVNNLARNLYLTLQLLELDVPMVLVVNMVDELKRQGKVLNYRRLERDLKIPVVPYSAKYHSDAHFLLNVCLERLNDAQNSVKLKYLDSLPIEEVKEIIAPNVKNAGLKLRYAAIKAMEKDAFVLEKLGLDKAQLAALDKLGDLRQSVAAARYSFIDSLTDGVIARDIVDEHHETHEHIMHNVPIEGSVQQAAQPAEPEINQKHIRHHDEHSDRRPFMAAVSKADKIFLNKYLALPIFFLIMALIFVVTFGLIGGPLSGLLETGIQKFIQQPVSSVMQKAPAWLASLVCDGIIGGVGGVIIFLPQIAVLFLFLAFLEDSGYISRIAFMTDGLFRKIGLSGRSAFTMLTGFGCSATAIMTARGLEDAMTRKKTVILTPFMSCSAKMPVYAAIAGEFFGFSPLVIFSLYIIGVAVAILFAAVMQKIRRLKSGKLSFILEIPPYRMPSTERVLRLIWNNVKLFIIRVGTVILALNVIVWALSNFSLKTGFITPDSLGQSQSVMAAIAGFIAPVFKPLGLSDWRIVTALLSGLAAKELVVSTVDTLGGITAVFGAGTDAQSLLTVYCFLVFTLLYSPCFSALAAMKSETGWKWTLSGFALYTVTAYLGALITRGIATLFINYTLITALTLTILVLGIIGFFIVRHINIRRGKKNEV